jgi:DNA-binding transcriptional ArsR family regulator
VLRELDIARANKEGKMVFYSLADEHVASLVRQGAEHAGEVKTRGRKTKR